MFCRKCGMKIIPGEASCRNCGEAARAGEYCGGFWGITGDEKREKARRQGDQEEKGSNSEGMHRKTEDLGRIPQQEIEKKRQYEMERERQFAERTKQLLKDNETLRRSRKKSLAVIAALAVLAGAFMVFSIISNASYRGLMKELAQGQSRIEEIEGQLSAQEKTLGELREHSLEMEKELTIFRIEDDGESAEEKEASQIGTTSDKAAVDPSKQKEKQKESEGNISEGSAAGADSPEGSPAQPGASEEGSPEGSAAGADSPEGSPAQPGTSEEGSPEGTPPADHPRGEAAGGDAAAENDGEKAGANGEKGTGSGAGEIDAGDSEDAESDEGNGGNTAEDAGSKEGTGKEDVRPPRWPRGH